MTDAATYVASLLGKATAGTPLLRLLLGLATALGATSALDLALILLLAFCGGCRLLLVLADQLTFFEGGCRGRSLLGLDDETTETVPQRVAGGYQRVKKLSRKRP
jgi:hypothetical protein